MSDRLEIPQHTIWLTPGGYQHAEYLQCEMCRDKLLKITDCNHRCPKNYKTDFPNWVAPWRPSEMDLTEGHYYSRQMLTKDANDIPNDIVVHWKNPNASAVQTKLW
jgi:hypothetical protein